MSILALAGVAALCCVWLPPLVAFEPQRLPALALVLAGMLLAFAPHTARSWMGAAHLIRTLPVSAPRENQRTVTAPLPTGEGVGGEVGADAAHLAPTPALQHSSRHGARLPTGEVLRISGGAILWGIIAWCVLSQTAPLTASLAQVESARALPLALMLAVWLWLQLPRDWQRRGLLGIAVPSLVALGMIGWPGPPRIANFAPYYVALDSHNTLYVSDAHAAVIRVFAPGGSLVAKLRPGLASRQGPPGPGFSAPGPYNDPDRLGVARMTPGASGTSAAVQPWPVGADDFWFCGMAVGAGDRLFVPDWMRARLLRFASDGHLEASWPLPAEYQPSLGCVASTGSALYLADTHGSILQLDPQDGHVLKSWMLGEAILGGISADPSGTVFALARSRVYRLDPRTGTRDSWSLPAPTGSLGQPYQAILATRDGRVLVANLAARRVDAYTAAGKPLGALGRPGSMPGEFGQVGGLAVDGGDYIYVADSDSRAVQRFSATGQINALYWSPDDDEIE